ncbi:hypothetical protein FSARC_11079 [Fusarium sarcochroum]|uniref:Uncharacterized protein n=1 Tax=Fusarium sarcochroum TaxID=1208366 RepID=A0A8H4THS7_9HYPO|nr:hypothetical protein FSARC_11079 [Fusarium sarcochroum]
MEEVPSEEVNGRAAFCILGTLAVAAVAQPSAGSRITDRVLLYGKFDLMRCFPGVCLVDALIDFAMLGKATRKEPSVPKSVHQTRQRVRPSAGELTVKLALLLLALLPPTIKVFSMAGVPATQFCAFSFFLANITNLIVQLCDIETSENYSSEGSEGIGFKDYMTLLFFLTLMSKMAFELWIWSKIGLSMSFHLPEDVEEICMMVRSVSSLLTCIQFIIWVVRYTIQAIRYVMYQRFDISTSPNMIPMRALWGLTIVLGTVKGPPVSQTEAKSGFTRQSDWMDGFIFTTGLYICTMLVSNILTKILDGLGLLATRDDEQSCTHTHAPAPTEKKEPDTEEVPSSSGHSSFLKTSAYWISTLATRIDDCLVQIFGVHTRAGCVVSLGLFNLVTTVCYYLVWFDGTGTVNTSWMTILGYHV